MARRNVLGDPLEPCSTDPMTGFEREPRPELNFPGLDPGDRWCLCVPRWVEALEAVENGRAPEPTVPPVVLAATNEAVLDTVSMETLRQHAFE
ncbi:DUF2237 domain-containing protein [Halobacteriales archaeon QS_9_70_65]|nr:MAG: DUF2237 domain-containing protein [Halobacteriales archaeon QS_9_70_65]